MNWIKRPKSGSLTENQWHIIASFIRNGRNIKDVLLYLQQTSPLDESISRLISGLNRGLPLYDLLGCSVYEKQLAVYLPYLAIPQAVAVCDKMAKNRQRLTDELLKRNVYPFVLLVGGIVLLFVFSRLVMPSMTALLDSSDAKGRTLSLMLAGIEVSRNVIAVLLVTALILMAAIGAGHKEMYVWMLLHRFKADRLIKSYATYRFVQYLQILLNQKTSFYDALQLIRHNKHDSYSALLAFQLDDALSRGLSLKGGVGNDFFDEEFIIMCRFSLQTADFDGMLNDYLQTALANYQKLLKRVTIGFQAGIYGFIALIIIVAYQILLLPLEMLNQL